MAATQTLSIIGEIQPGPQGFVINLNTKFAAGLAGLDEFSHAVVLWWAGEADSKEDRERLVYEKPYTNNPNDVGVFGSRSPSRPNPIGLSVVTIQSVDMKDANIITPYIDTEPGTPVIDVKPYYPASDRVRDVAVPQWCAHWPVWLEDSAEFDWMGEFE